jgi:hypothetical protein
MRVHLPTATGEPAGENIRQLRRSINEIARGFHAF